MSNLMGRSSKQNWNKTGTGTAWTCKAHRGYTASIESSTGQYVLTITGAGAPGPVSYPTLKLAKNAFSVFLRTK